MDWDTTLFHEINSLAGQSPFLDWVMVELSQEGNLLFPIILSTIYWFWTRWGEAIIAAPGLGLLIGIGDFVGGQLKWIIGRPRPCHTMLHLNELVGCGGMASLPSNHALNSATAAAFLSVLYPATGWITWPLVGLIGVSRVYLGAHYVTDVVGGWCLGVMIGVGGGVGLLHWRRFGRRKADSPSTPP